MSALSLQLCVLHLRNIHRENQSRRTGEFEGKKDRVQWYKKLKKNNGKERIRRDKVCEGRTQEGMLRGISGGKDIFEESYRKLLQQRFPKIYTYPKKKSSTGVILKQDNKAFTRHHKIKNKIPEAEIGIPGICWLVCSIILQTLQTTAPPK